MAVMLGRSESVTLISSDPTQLCKVRCLQPLLFVISTVRDLYCLKRGNYLCLKRYWTL
jgi:hypothetical protein